MVVNVLSYFLSKRDRVKKRINLASMQISRAGRIGRLILNVKWYIEGKICILGL